MIFVLKNSAKSLEREERNAIMFSWTHERTWFGKWSRSLKLINTFNENESRAFDFLVRAPHCFILCFLWSIASLFFDPMFSALCSFATLCTIARQAPLSMRFSRQEYWSALPCPLPGDLPDPGIKPTSLMFPALASRFFIISTALGSPTSIFRSPEKSNCSQVTKGHRICNLIMSVSIAWV